MTKRRLLVCGDYGVSSGFGRALTHICESLSPEFDVHILGINFQGDSRQPDGSAWPYPVYHCPSGGDAFGLGRMKNVIETVGPALILVQQDPWNFQSYLELVKNVPMLGAVAVDGKCCRGTKLNGLAHAIFWTEFGRKEANLGGYTGDSTVIPLGVDLDIYQPYSRKETHERMSIPRVLQMRGLPPDTFIVGSVGRNQARKRLDLTIEYFAEWVHSKNIKDAALWLHLAPTGDDAFDLTLLGKYYGVSDRIMIPQIAFRHGVSEDTMAYVYNIFDVLLSTSQGEGWSLPTQEAMACGTPCIVPAWAALGDWAKDASLQVRCSSTICTPPRDITTIGGIADKQETIEALDAMYRDKTLRRLYSKRGVDCVHQTQYRWENIGAEYLRVANVVVNAAPLPANITEASFVSAD